ncbi:MAG: hypothetical protein V1707_03335 [bacterium]
MKERYSLDQIWLIDALQRLDVCPDCVQRILELDKVRTIVLAMKRGEGCLFFELMENLNKLDITYSVSIRSKMSFAEFLERHIEQLAGCSWKRIEEAVQQIYGEYGKEQSEEYWEAIRAIANGEKISVSA